MAAWVWGGSAALLCLTLLQAGAASLSDEGHLRIRQVIRDAEGAYMHLLLFLWLQAPPQ